MGTRSITYVHNGDTGSPKLMAMYRHWDGSPQGHGRQLVSFLKPIRLVNGLSSQDANRTIANGMDCLAAQIVAHFKTEAGNFYLVPPQTTAKDCDAEYEYHVYCRPRGKWRTAGTAIRLKCIQVAPKAILFDDRVQKLEEKTPS